MADFVERSQVAIHDWSHVYGNGYAPEYFGGTSRFRISRTAITKMAGNQLLGECTFTIIFDSNQTEDPPAQRNSGYNYAVDYEVWIAGVRRGVARLVERTQYINKETRYTRTLKATNIPLDATTTRSAFIRTVNDRPSSQALLFDSRNQGGDSLSGFPLGVQQSTFASVSNFTVNNAITAIPVSVTANTSGVTHTLTLKYGSTTIATWSSLGNVTSVSLTLTQARALLTAMNTVKTATLVMSVATVYGGSTIYTQNRNVVATVGVLPTIGTVTITDSTGAESGVGALVQGISRITLAMTSPVAGYGSTVSSYAFSWDGQNHTGKSSATLVTGLVQNTGSQIFKGTLTNSRSQSVSKSLTKTVVAWSPPSSSGINASRSNALGAPDGAGSYLRVTGSHSVSPLKVGTTNKNTFRVIVRYKVKNASSWIVALDKTYPAGTVSSSESHTLAGGNLSPLSSYDIEITVYDRFSSYTTSRTIASEAVPLSFGKNIGIGVGKIWERGAIDAKGDVYVDGDLLVGGMDMVATIADLIPVHGTASFATIPDYLDDVLESIPNQSVSFRATPIAGTRWIIMIHRTGSQLMVFAYTTNSAKIFFRNSSTGVWQEVLTTGGGGGGDGGVVTSFSSSINGTLYQAMAEAYSAGALPLGRSFQMVFTNAGSVYSFQGNTDYDGRVYGLLLSSLSRRIVTRTSSGSWGIVNITTTAY